MPEQYEEDEVEVSLDHKGEAAHVSPALSESRDAADDFFAILGQGHDRPKYFSTDDGKEVRLQVGKGGFFMRVQAESTDNEGLPVIEDTLFSTDTDGEVSAVQQRDATESWDDEIFKEKQYKPTDNEREEVRAIVRAWIKKEVGGGELEDDRRNPSFKEAFEKVLAGQEKKDAVLRDGTIVRVEKGKAGGFYVETFGFMLRKKDPKVGFYEHQHHIANADGYLVNFKRGMVGMPQGSVPKPGEHDEGYNFLGTPPREMQQERVKEILEELRAGQK